VGQQKVEHRAVTLVEVLLLAVELQPCPVGAVRIEPETHREFDPQEAGNVVELQAAELAPGEVVRDLARAPRRSQPILVPGTRVDLAHLGSPIAAPFASPRYRRCSPAGLSVIRHDIARNELTE